MVTRHSKAALSASKMDVSPSQPLESARLRPQHSYAGGVYAPERPFRHRRSRNTMITLNRTFQIARHTLAFSAVLGMGIAVAHAQQAAAPAVTAEPTLNFQLPVDIPAA